MYGGGGGGDALFAGGGDALFAGGGFMTSQTTQTPESSFSSTRGTQALLPLTVKQIVAAYEANDDKSNFLIDGVEASAIRLMGRITGLQVKSTEVMFTLDDCTGRVDIKRWVNDASDNAEMELIQDGMYVTINGNLKGFQGKKQLIAFAMRPVTDFNDITYHFIECIHVHLENTRPKVQGGGPALHQAMGTPARSEVRGYQAPASNQFPVNPSTSASYGDICQAVLDVFQEPANLAMENGLHVDDVARLLGIPKAKAYEIIAYHVDLGSIYSTIDDYHFRSAANG